MLAAHSTAEAALADHIERLRLYLRRRLSCEHDAQDLAQEACLNMLQAERSGEIRQPRAYLHQIANHLLYQHYSARAERLHTGVDLDSVVSPQLPLEETVELQVRQQQIKQAMRTLPPKCQTVVVLRCRHGLRVAEIAEHINLSRGMVKKYLANSLKHFRRDCGASPMPMRAHDAIRRNACHRCTTAGAPLNDT